MNISINEDEATMIVSSLMFSVWNDRQLSYMDICLLNDLVEIITNKLHDREVVGATS